MKINKCEKLVSNIQNKENYIIHIVSLNHGSKLSKVHKVTEFEQEAWLKLYIMMNIELPIQAKNDFEKEQAKNDFEKD